LTEYWQLPWTIGETDGARARARMNESGARCAASWKRQMWQKMAHIVSGRSLLRSCWQRVWADNTTNQE
jgi:hypothetical protein